MARRSQHVAIRRNRTSVEGLEPSHPDANEGEVDPSILAAVNLAVSNLLPNIVAQAVEAAQQYSTRGPPPVLETLGEYLARFLRLAGFAGLSPETSLEQAEKFKWTIHYRYRSKLINEKFTDVALAVDAAKNIEMKRQDFLASKSDGGNKRSQDGQQIQQMGQQNQQQGGNSGNQWGQNSSKRQGQWQGQNQGQRQPYRQQGQQGQGQNQTRFQRSGDKDDHDSVPQCNSCRSRRTVPPSRDDRNGFGFLVRCNQSMTVNESSLLDPDFSLLLDFLAILLILTPGPEILSKLSSQRNLLADTSNIVEKNKACKRKDELMKLVAEALLLIGYDASICKSRWEKSYSYPTADRLQQILSIVSEAAKLSLKKEGMHIPPWRKFEYMRSKWLSAHIRTPPSPSPSLLLPPPPTPPPTPNANASPK
ncbi:Protein of unknown function DUF506, plant [Cynara cardunculus var. scolymus]|uniref:Uncharacterized protein n=1 Tax=Cynara cardunculus var. scolymus TaxID=59895 RepID=A0A118JSS1_CYNCS|nr:Protein of unknown function DUF506, plant [Cynara cardunculus var. scolymus]